MASWCFLRLVEVGVGPGGKTIEGTTLHIDFSLASDSGDDTFAGEEAGEESTCESDMDGDGRFVSDEVTGVDDMFSGDFFFEDCAVGSEPNTSLAVDFQAEQAFAGHPAFEAGPAESESHGGVTGDESAGLQEHGIALQFGAYDVSGEGLGENHFAVGVG